MIHDLIGLFFESIDIVSEKQIREKMSKEIRYYSENKLPLVAEEDSWEDEEEDENDIDYLPMLVAVMAMKTSRRK